jgi:hypothetical protein
MQPKPGESDDEFSQRISEQMTTFFAEGGAENEETSETEETPEVEETSETEGTTEGEGAEKIEETGDTEYE